MKKTILTLAIVASSAFVWAQQPVKLKSDNVNMYRQPGTNAEVAKVVNSSDEVILVRKFNSEWSIVMAGGETGYIHNVHLQKIKKQPEAKE